MKAAFVALCLASVALAQTNSTNTGIPADASPACGTFLGQLNNNPVINTCLNSLISHTAVFDPATPNANTTNANQAAVSSALSNICSSSSNSCPDADIRAILTTFYTACQSDLLGASNNGTDGKKDVIAIYDSLYLIIPLKGAICSKVNGKYCINRNAATPSTTLTQASSGSSSSSASASASASSAPTKRDVHLVARQATNTNGTNQETLNDVGSYSDEYRESGLPYLFIQPNSTNICGDECTAQIIGSYIRFETVTPYAIGIANSPLLRGQVALWERIKQCPDGFAQTLLDSSTGNNASSTGGAAKTVAGVGSALVAVLAAVGATFML